MAGGVGQVIFVGAVTVVAVEEAEIGLAAGKIHNYIQCSAQRRDARRLISQWSGLLYVCDRPRSLSYLALVCAGHKRGLLDDSAISWVGTRVSVSA